MKKLLAIPFTNKKAYLINTLSTASLCVMAIFACLYFHPSSISWLAVKEKHIILSSLLIFAFAFDLFQKRNTIFTSSDFWWLALVVYCGFGVFWSKISAFGIFESFHFVLLYLVFKLFEKINWEDELTRKLTTNLTLVVSILLIAFQLFYIFTLGLLGDNPSYERTPLHFIPCTLAIIILPYTLFTNEKISNYLAAFLLAVNCIAAIILGLLQAVLVLLLLSIIYILFKMEYVRRVKYFVLIGFMFIIGSSLYVGLNQGSLNDWLDNSNPVAQKSQIYLQDLALSTDQFKASPIIGHGAGSSQILSRNSIQNSITYFWPNNSILSILCEYGIIGFIIFCYLGFFPVMRLFNDRLVLSRLELAAVISLALFLFLSLFYGETYSRPKFFANASVIATMSLAFINAKANRNTLIFETKHKGASLIFLLAAVGCLVYFVF